MARLNKDYKAYLDYVDQQKKQKAFQAQWGRDPQGRVKPPPKSERVSAPVPEGYSRRARALTDAEMTKYQKMGLDPLRMATIDTPVAPMSQREIDLNAYIAGSEAANESYAQSQKAELEGLQLEAFKRSMNAKAPEDPEVTVKRMELRDAARRDVMESEAYNAKKTTDAQRQAMLDKVDRDYMAPGQRDVLAEAYAQGGSRQGGGTAETEKGVSYAIGDTGGYRRTEAPAPSEAAYRVPFYEEEEPYSLYSTPRYMTGQSSKGTPKAKKGYSPFDTVGGRAVKGSLKYSGMPSAALLKYFGSFGR